MELGEDVDGWKVGDRVTADGTARSGRYNICQNGSGGGDDGAFADYVAGEALPDSEGVSQREAAVAEPLAWISGRYEGRMSW